MSKKCEK